jgi:uncharacterized protein (TIGR02391 family)
MAQVKPFARGTLEHIARAFADFQGLTGREIGELLEEAGLDDPWPDGTKWKRLREALEVRQRNDRAANAVCHFINVAMDMRRFAGRAEEHQALVRELNQCLLLEGLEVARTGKLRPAERARDLPEAERRADRLRAELQRRRVHPYVLKFCQAELVKDNYFHAVLEASKSIFARIREVSGLAGDGVALVDAAFSLKRQGAPPIAFNSLRTQSEKSAHGGYANFARGIAGAFRNRTAHEPKVEYPMSEEDALDTLVVISMVHRALDSAVATPSAPSYAARRADN